MSTTDSRIDAYIAAAPDFARPILNHLRSIVHAGCPEVEETLKWRMPFFLHRGILCNMAAFKQHCSFGFWKSTLIPAREGAHGNFGRITSLADLPEKAVLIACVRKMAQSNAAGIKPPAPSRPKQKKPLVVPADFKAALKKNRKALETFDKFSYSHKKEYVEWITEAKREETRTKRLATALAWLSEGKPRHWKYANC